MKMSRAALCALIFSNSVLAAPRDPLPPTAPWIVDFADAQCHATRNYGPGEKPLFLVVKEPPAGQVLQIGIISKGATGAPEQMAGQLIFDSQPPIGISLMQFDAKPDNKILLTTVAENNLAAMRSASSLRIVARDERDPLSVRDSFYHELPAASVDLSLKVTQLGALVDMLDKCVANLRKVWNVEDGDGAPASIRSRPSGNLSKLFGWSDYPEIALLKHQVGSMTIAALVDENGRVADCTVIETSGIASLDAQSCAIIRERAQLKPAIGMDGKPTKGALVQKISWDIE